MRIIVVGAGVAGLTAAGRLTAQGHEVVVVEGRDRIGGRTHTAEVGTARVDLGASWIHGPLGNPLTDEVRRAGLSVHNDGAWGLGAHVFIEGEGWADPNEVASSVASRFDYDPNEVIDALGRDGTMAEGADWYIANRGLRGREARIVDFGIRSLESGLNIGGPAEEISLSGAGWYELHSGGNAVITGGYRRLVDHLAAGLDIRLGRRVDAIEHATAGGVVVHTTDGRLEADQAVLAVPLGVIKQGTMRIDPDPGLAERATRLGVATLEKIVLQFETPFWSNGTKRLIRVSDDRRFPGWNDLSSHTGAPTLVVFHNPRLAATHLDAPDRIPAALDALRQMFGADVPDPVATHSTDWATDPFSFGSYSFPSIGATMADMAAMGGRLSDRLVGAGEHTVPEHYGTVHAAYLSGIRAAAAFA